MLNFKRMALLSGSKDNFVGVRAPQEGDQPYFMPTDEAGRPQADLTFALPHGFEGYGLTPQGELDTSALSRLFFLLYRTFERFASDNHKRRRLGERQQADQAAQDQLERASGGVGEQLSQEGSAFGYFKLRSLEQTLLTISELSFARLISTHGPRSEIDYSKLYLYLDRGLYLDNHAVFIDQMELPRNVLLEGAHELVELYCYLLDEVLMALDEDVIDPPDAPGLITSAIERLRHEIKSLAERFRDRHLTQLGGLFEGESAEFITLTLREVFEQLDQRTLYRDRDFWTIFNAVESFLYAELDPNAHNGTAWGMYGFSFVWEDLCHAWFFRSEREVLYADADLRLEGHHNPKRKDRTRVGNKKVGALPGADESRRRELQYVYCADYRWSVQERYVKPTSDKITTSNPPRHTTPPSAPRATVKRFDMSDLLCVQTYDQRGFLAQGVIYAERKRPSHFVSPRRQLRPDMVTFEPGSAWDDQRPKVEIWDYKYVGAEFFQFASDKLKGDRGKNLAAELALKPGFEIGAERNRFLLPIGEVAQTKATFAAQREVFQELSLSVWGLSLEAAMRAYLNLSDEPSSSPHDVLVPLAVGEAPTRHAHSSFALEEINDVIDSVEQLGGELFTPNVFRLTAQTQALAEVANQHIQEEVRDFCELMSYYHYPQPARYLPYAQSIEPIADLSKLSAMSEAHRAWCLDHLFVTLGPRAPSAELLAQPSLMFSLDDRAAPCVVTYRKQGRQRAHTALCRFTLMYYGQEAHFDQAACYVIHIRPQELMDVMKRHRSGH